MSVNQVSVFTTTISGVFVLPSGARTIDLNNTGLADAKIMGNSTKNSTISTPVSVLIGQAYSFGDLGKPYPELTFDATGTTLEIIANY